jgi:hypothetical protein
VSDGPPLPTGQGRSPAPTPMADRPRKALMMSPFYVALLLASAAFLVTTFGYLASPYIQRQAHADAGAGPGPASLALADWLDRMGPTVLAVEVGAMLVFGLLAMATDRWFFPGVARKGSKSG